MFIFVLTELSVGQDNMLKFNLWYPHCIFFLLFLKEIQGSSIFSLSLGILMGEKQKLLMGKHSSLSVKA